MHVEAHRGEQAREEGGIVDGAADEHRDHRSDALPLHHLGQDAGPLLGPVPLRQRIEDQRLVGAAGHALGDAAEKPVRQAAEHENPPAIPRRRDEENHLGDHEACRRDDQRLPPDPVGQDTGRQVGEDDRKRPGEVHQRVLGTAEAQVEKEDRQDRVVEPGIEKNPKENEAMPISIGVGDSHATGFVRRGRERGFFHGIILTDHDFAASYQIDHLTSRFHLIPPKKSRDLSKLTFTSSRWRACCP